MRTLVSARWTSSSPAGQHPLDIVSTRWTSSAPAGHRQHPLVSTFGSLFMDNLAIHPLRVAPAGQCPLVSVHPSVFAGQCENRRSSGSGRNQMRWTPRNGTANRMSGGLEGTTCAGLKDFSEHLAASTGNRRYGRDESHGSSLVRWSFQWHFQPAVQRPEPSGQMTLIGLSCLLAPLDEWAGKHGFQGCPAQLST